MPLVASCPRCRELVADPGEGCRRHGVMPPLWTPSAVSYDDFAEHLARAGRFPTHLPWPLGPGWHVSDFGVVAGRAEVHATLTCTSGSTEPDGPVDVFCVSEESGTGLGARIAGLARDPVGIGDGPPLTKVRMGTFSVPLWPVSTSAVVGEMDRAVVVGEAAGRWLWMVLRPASAILLLRDPWILRDASELGPSLVEVGFGGPRPPW